jgi:hypothetical protein
MRSCSSLVCAAVTAATLSFAGSAYAEPELTVASGPSPQPSNLRVAADKAQKGSERREGVELGGSVYVLTAPVLADFRQAGVLLRPTMELYAAFGLGNASLILGGSVLGVEGGFYGDHQSVAFPMLATIGVRGDRFVFAAAGGASLGYDNSYGDTPDHEKSLPVSARGAPGRLSLRWFG